MPIYSDSSKEFDIGLIKHGIIFHYELTIFLKVFFFLEFAKEVYKLKIYYSRNLNKCPNLWFMQVRAERASHRDATPHIHMLVPLASCNLNFHVKKNPYRWGEIN